MSATDTPGGYERCGAATRSGGKCKLPAGHGTDHVGVGSCRRHGGNTRTHKAAAAKILAERAVQTYGLPREIPPEQALLEEVWRTAGHVDWLGRVVAGLEDGSLVWGVSEHREGFGPEGKVDITTRKAAVNVWVQLYQAERKHLREVCRDAVTAGVAERQVRLAEQQGEMLAGVLRAVLDELGVLDRPETAGVVRRHLLAMASIETTGGAA